MIAQKSVLTVLAANVLFSYSALAQTTFRFEVTSVKPSHSGGNAVWNQFAPNRVTYTNVTVRELISEACRANGAAFSGIFGAPGWLSSTRWDVVGEVPEQPGGKRYDLRPMLCSLLEDRFHLRFHSENRMMPSYELIVAKGGPKMTARGEAPPKMRVTDGLRSGQSNMRDFAFSLRLAVHRDVTDKTGLAGVYEFSLSWSSEGLGSGAEGDPPSPPDPDHPSLFTALQEQLGLKLVPLDTLQRVLVIDHIERPTEN